jgi:hypothetical protein
MRGIYISSDRECMSTDAEVVRKYEAAQTAERAADDAAWLKARDERAADDAAWLKARDEVTPPPWTPYKAKCQVCGGPFQAGPHQYCETCEDRKRANRMAVAERDAAAGDEWKRRELAEAFARDQNPSAYNAGPTVADLARRYEWDFTGWDCEVNADGSWSRIRSR